MFKKDQKFKSKYFKSLRGSNFISCLKKCAKRNLLQNCSLSWWGHSEECAEWGNLDEDDDNDDDGGIDDGNDDDDEDDGDEADAEFLRQIEGPSKSGKQREFRRRANISEKIGP